MVSTLTVSLCRNKWGKLANELPADFRTPPGLAETCLVLQQVVPIDHPA